MIIVTNIFPKSIRKIIRTNMLINILGQYRIQVSIDLFKAEILMSH